MEIEDGGEEEMVLEEREDAKMEDESENDQI